MGRRIPFRIAAALMPLLMLLGYAVSRALPLSPGRKLLFAAGAMLVALVIAANDYRTRRLRRAAGPRSTR